MSTQIAEQSDTRARQVALEAMDKNNQVTFKIQYLIETYELGGTIGAADDGDKLPACLKIWSPLKRERCTEIMKTLDPLVCADTVLDDMTAVELRRLMGFALSVDLSSALPNKSMWALIAWASRRYTDMHKRLVDIIFVPGGADKRVPNYSRPKTAPARCSALST